MGIKVQFVFELVSDVCPQTCKNFSCLCTDLSRILWFKVVTSLKEMVEKGDLSMEDFWKIRVLLLNTTNNFSCQWPTEGRLQMVHSSS
uniref:PPIase cyclophilin-type domain-containing protein n=1 Tax=Saimiri boliviensis boliviensis TaxID=39432 RepID=A0A2K6T8S8_SAIBB